MQAELVTTSRLLHGWKVHGGKPWFITCVSVPAVPCSCSHVESSGFEGWEMFFLFKSFQNVNSMIFRDLGPINIMIEISALGAEWFLGYTCIFHFQLIQACPVPEAQVLHSFQMLFGYRLGVSLSNYNSGNEDI